MRFAKMIAERTVKLCLRNLFISEIIAMGFVAYANKSYMRFAGSGLCLEPVCKPRIKEPNIILNKRLHFGSMHSMEPANVTNMKKYIVLFILALNLFGLFITVAPALAAADWTMPDPEIKIPVTFTAPTCDTDSNGNSTNCKVNWIGQYVAGIYIYLVGIIGIIAVVVMMFGGLRWIVAGGNSASITEAKAWITASLTGLVLVLLSYTVLYIINPDLTIFKSLNVAMVKTEAASSTLPIASTASVCLKYKDANNVVIYDNISEKAALPPSCSNFNFDQYGSQSKFLKSIAATETNCNATLTSGAGACGLMQLMPATAQKYDPLATCQYLIDNPDKSILIASKFINDNIAVHKGNPALIFAGYNSGYSTLPNPITGKKSAIVPSSDCPGYLAFQCCILPGGLVETQNYTYKALEFLNSQ